MKTDVIRISSRGEGFETAMQQADAVASYKELSPKNALHLRLLTEEMMGLMRSITGETEGDFWIEDKRSEYQLHLRVVTPMDSLKREQLLSTSSSGKNENARGLMGRLRNFFEAGVGEGGVGPLYTGVYEDPSAASMLDYEWSMLRYEDQLASRMQNDAEAHEAWDELEKSVVRHVADDIRVSIKGCTVELIILKKMD